MRKNSPRKLLHAILDLLPVILIPVFMIYSHRHNVAEDTLVTKEEPVYFQTNEITSYNDFVIGNVYSWNDNLNWGGTGQNINVLNIENNNVIQNFYNIPSDATNITFYVNENGKSRLKYLSNGTTIYISTTDNEQFNFVVLSVISQPSELLSHFSDCEVQYIKEYQEVTYTLQNDVMSSFVQTFNNTVDTYFNMGNVFNLGDVYQWFNTNIFGGNAPTIIYSVWNIALYEFVMDLLMLLYALFMWFIDMCQNLIDRSFNSMKGN